MYAMNADDWKRLYDQGKEHAPVGRMVGDKIIASTSIPAGTALYSKDPDEVWAVMPKVSSLKWTIPVWCYRKCRWMSFDLKDKDWSKYIVEWKELQLDQPEAGCKPVPPDGWEVPDDWERFRTLCWESNLGHVIYGTYFKTFAGC